MAKESTFELPAVSAEQDIDTFFDACVCIDMNTDLLWFISREFLGCRILARKSGTVQPTNVRKFVNSKYFFLMILTDTDCIAVRRVHGSKLTACL